MKIRKTILFISLILIFGCEGSGNKEKSIQSFKIKGDWVTETFEDDWGKKTLIFSFQDTLCTYLYPFGEFTRYWIIGDTLKIKERGRFRYGYEKSKYIEGKEIYSFLVKGKNEQEIILNPLSQSAKSLLKRNKNVGLQDELKLRAIAQRNDFKYDRIAFYSTGCYGTCPIIYLEIDAKGNLFFYGKKYTEKEGIFKGKINTNEIDLINKKINAIQLDSLKRFYSAPWTDSQTCGIKVKIGDKIFESSAYGVNEEPIELRFLLHKVMEIYKTTELESDSMVVNEFQFEEFMFRGIPPPPPPEVKENKNE